MAWKEAGEVFDIQRPLRRSEDSVSHLNVSRLTSGFIFVAVIHFHEFTGFWCSIVHTFAHIQIRWDHTETLLRPRDLSWVEIGILCVGANSGRPSYTFLCMLHTPLRERDSFVHVFAREDTWFERGSHLCQIEKSFPDQGWCTEI